MASLGERIENLKAGRHDVECMTVINELLDRLYIARKGMGDVVSEALKQSRLDQMDRMLAVGWEAAVRSDIYD